MVLVVRGLHNKLKILTWEKNGFIVWYKRLERDRFPWPRKIEAAVCKRQSNHVIDLLA
jgi:transposase